VWACGKACNTLPALSGGEILPPLKADVSFATLESKQKERGNFAGFRTTQCLRWVRPSFSASRSRPSQRMTSRTQSFVLRRKLPRCKRPELAFRDIEKVQQNSGHRAITGSWISLIFSACACSEFRCHSPPSSRTLSTYQPTTVSAHGCMTITFHAL